MLFPKSHRFLTPLLIVMTILVVIACSSDRFVPDGQYLLDKVELRSDRKDVNSSLLMQYVRQRGNSRWFSLFKIPLGTYAMAGEDTTKWINRTLRRMGEEPVLYDSVQARLSSEDLMVAMQNMGYMNATVDIEKKVKGKKLTLNYLLHPGNPYIINRFNYEIEDSVIERVLAPHLKKDTERPHQFTVTSLDDERKKLTHILNDSGFYKFHKDFMYYTADSTQGRQHVNVTLHLMKYVENSDAKPTLHPRYVINNVNFIPGDSTGFHLRKGVLEDNTLIEKGKYFSATDLQKTYNNFSRLGAVRYTNINFREVPRYDSLVIGKTFTYTTSSAHYLDADIQVSNNKPNTISFQPEGTNTAGDLGAAAVLSYQNRNLFRGSEHLSLEFRAAFEAIKGLEGYKNSDYEEYSVQAHLQFPRFLAPFISKNFKRKSSATSEVSVGWNLQNRPEFHRRVFSSAWKYHWSDPVRHLTYDFDLLNLSYVYMPWISETFKHDYLDNATTRNAILRYNYQDLFILRTGFGVNYSGANQAFRARMELAGNLLNGLSGVFNFKKNSEGKRTLFNIAYAQYAKAELEYIKHIPLSIRKNGGEVFAFRTFIGFAKPYGNANSIPFSRSYFAGGSNDNRGWRAYALGPGSSGSPLEFNEANFKFTTNAEYRFTIANSLKGALFLDVGNVWHLLDNEEDTDYKLDRFSDISDLGLATGFGLRYDMSYFVIRGDFGMKLYNPSKYVDSHWTTKLRLSNFVFNIGINYPF